LYFDENAPEVEDLFSDEDDDVKEKAAIEK